jgi:hypothetical protein
MVNRFQKIDRLSNRRVWISRAVKGSLSAWCPCFQKDRTSTAGVSCRNRHVCAGLRRRAVQRLAEITQTFIVDDFAICPGGADGPIAAKCKKSNSQKLDFQKLQIAKTQILKTFVTIFFREIDPKIVFRKIVFVLTIRGNTFASSPLSSIPNLRGAGLTRASSVPMKRRHLPG